MKSWSSYLPIDFISSQQQYYVKDTSLDRSIVEQSLAVPHGSELFNLFLFVTSDPCLGCLSHILKTAESRPEDDVEDVGETVLHRITAADI